MEDWSKRELSSNEKTSLKVSPICGGCRSWPSPMHRWKKLSTPHRRKPRKRGTPYTWRPPPCAFDGSEGSLNKLNFLGGLGGADNTSAALVDDNDKKLMVTMVARKGESGRCLPFTHQPRRTPSPVRLPTTLIHTTRAGSGGMALCWWPVQS